MRPRACSKAASSVARKRSRSKGCSNSTQRAAGPDNSPSVIDKAVSISIPTVTLSEITSQSKTESPDPFKASALRSLSLTSPCDNTPLEKACCITVKPTSITKITITPTAITGANSSCKRPIKIKPIPATQISSKNQVGISNTARS